MINIFLTTAVFTLAGALYAEKRNSTFFIFIFKFLTSALFILTASFFGIDGTYSIYITIGLILSLIGDVVLIPKGQLWFLAGLISFLLAHISYIFAFIYLVPFKLADLANFIFIVVISGGIIIWLWVYLGNMKYPVMFYVLIISVMLWRAWMVFKNPYFGLDAKLLISFGATLFYISDLFVALDTFVKSSFKNKLFGLPLYYAGQFLLALSVLEN